MKKKVNPRKRPASQADVNKAKKEATNEAINIAWSIFFSVLRDKEGYEANDLKRIWKEVEYLSDSIKAGYVDVYDLMKTLDEEAGIVLV